MTCRLEVVCETIFGETLVVTGADSTFGEWDVFRGVELRTDPAVYPTWVANVVSLPPGTEFKFAVISACGNFVRWEPTACNRRWPSELPTEGCLVLSAKFGEGGHGLTSLCATILAACPESFKREVTGICKANNIALALGCWNDTKVRLEEAWQKWEQEVLATVIRQVQETEARTVRIICIEGGRWAGLQKAKQSDLLHAVCSALGDPAFPVSVTWTTLSIFKGEFVSPWRKISSYPELREYSMVGGGSSTPRSKQRREARTCPSSPAGADAAAGAGVDRFGTMPRKARSSTWPSNTASELSSLAEELYGPGSDEAALIAQHFSGAGYLSLPLPIALSGEGCEFFDMSPDGSPSPREAKKEVDGEAREAQKPQRRRRGRSSSPTKPPSTPESTALAEAVADMPDCVWERSLSTQSSNGGASCCASWREHSADSSSSIASCREDGEKESGCGQNGIEELYA